MAKELMEIGGFITEGAEIVNHDNSLSGNGTSASPLGVDSDYIVVTEETVGTYSVANSDVGVSGLFSKTGYKPIAWTWKYGFAAALLFNQEGTVITNNTLNFQGYIRNVVGSDSRKITFKLFITWVRV
jgi:hypothetical protein